MKKYILGIMLLGSAMLSSCNDWLDVTSNTEIPNEVHFSSETGFKDAVIGLYVKLSKPELYGKTLTWHVNEFLSQNYAQVAGAPDLDLPKYEYEESPFVGYRDMIWQNCYEVIANMNNILRYEEKNRSMMRPLLDSIVRGETLGLRAMVHFDLLRMFGKSNLGKRPELMEELSIPYSLQFSKNSPEQVTYKRYLELLKKDIKESITLLECDPYNVYRWGENMISYHEYYQPIVDNSFITSEVNFYQRQFRFNCYAAKALYARILMWEGTPEARAEALKIASELVEKSRYSWAYENQVMVKNQEWWKSDLLFKNEHLFTLSVEKMADYQFCSGGTQNWFDASSPGNTYTVVYLTKQKAEEIYEVPGAGDSDWRYTQCLLSQYWGYNYGLVKLRQHPEHAPQYSRMMPMIRISEMCYIAAECCLDQATYDKTKAIEYLNMVRSHRGIAQDMMLPETLTDEEVKNEIYKEYLKEFVGEGQMFFYYKRLGATSIPGYKGEMTDLQYQFPMPDDEIILGGRVEDKD